MSLEPVAAMPLMNQVSSTFTSSARTSIMRTTGGLPSPMSSMAFSMAQSACMTTVPNFQRPEMRKPPSTRTALPGGAATLGAMT
ncbi:hypothetical protein D9M68_942640 [compost metagenome]